MKKLSSTDHRPSGSISSPVGKRGFLQNLLGMAVAAAALPAAAVTAAMSAPGRVVRVLGPSGQLVAMAKASDTPGLLHPDVVLL